MTTEEDKTRLWDELHIHLRDNLHQEVRLARELLSNMHQEEVSRLLSDQGTLNQVLSQQFHLFERLSQLRLWRQEMTGQIEKMVVDGKKLLSLDTILPPLEETTAEILSLTDQLVSLTERMNRQHCHNQHLAKRPERIGGGIHFGLVKEERPKRKASIATYNLNK